MKSKYWILLNMQMLRYWNPLFFHREKSGKGSRKNLAVGVGIAVVGMVTMLYSGMAAYGYTQMGAAHMIPRLMSSLSAWMTFLFLFLKSEGALFGCKDFDLMGSLPVGTAVIAAVRVTFAYLTGLFISFLIMLPAFAVYAIYERAGAGEFLLLLVLIFTIPILPTVLALFLGTVVLTLTSRFPFRHFFSLLLNLGLLSVFLLWTTRFSFQVQSPEALADFGIMLAELCAHIYPPGYLAVSFFEGRGIWGFLLYQVVSVGILTAFFFLVGTFYIQIEGMLASFRQRKRKKVEVGKRNTIFMALYKKELRRLFTCTIYAMNTLVGMLLLVLFGLAVLVMGPENLERMVDIPGVAAQMQVTIPMILGMLVCLGSTTAPSLSLEGRARWIMCSIPVEPMVIFLSKIAVHLSLSLPCILVSGICILIRFPIRGSDGVLLFAVPMAYSLFAAVFGMYANVKFPNFDWNHEQQVVKNSMSVMVSVFSGMFLGMVPVFLCMFFPEAGTGISAGAAALVMFLSLLCFWKLKKVERVAE